MREGTLESRRAPPSRSVSAAMNLSVSASTSSALMSSSVGRNCVLSSHAARMRHKYSSSPCLCTDGGAFTSGVAVPLQPRVEGREVRLLPGIPPRRAAQDRVQVSLFTIHCLSDIYDHQNILEVGRFLKIRNCELGFLLPLSQMRNCESENDSFFDSFPIPLDYDSGSNSIKITKNGQ